MRQVKTTVMAVMAVAATLTVLWLTQGPDTLKKAFWADAVAEAQRGGYQLITTDDLWQQYRQSPDNLLLVDTRQEWEYRIGHMDGAVNFPMKPTLLAQWTQRGKLSEFLGQDKDRSIVFY